MDTNDRITSLAIDEVINRTFGVTQQYLEVMEVEYQNNLPNIKYIDINMEGDFAVIYFSIVNEPFFLAIGIRIQPDISITGVWIESCNELYLNISSKDLSSSELKLLTKFVPSEEWNKGDLRSDGKTRYNFSCIKFYVSKNPGSFDDKMYELLNFLEKDSIGIRNLAQKTQVSIVGYIRMYVGNSMLGGPSLDREIISRMNNLGLGIEYDLYVSGVPFND